jgi:hypothetical protein
MCAATMNLPLSEHTTGPTICSYNDGDDSSEASTTTGFSSATSRLPAEAWTRIAHFGCLDGGLNGSRLLLGSPVVGHRVAQNSYATVALRRYDSPCSTAPSVPQHAIPVAGVPSVLATPAADLYPHYWLLVYMPSVSKECLQALVLVLVLVLARA